MTTMKGNRVITNVYLDPEVFAALKRLAERTDIPMAHYLRQGVDHVLSKYGEKVKAPRRGTK